MIIHFGTDALDHLPEILSAHSARTVFLVTGKQSYRSSGAEQKLAPFLKDLSVVFFTDFSPNPSRQDIEKGVELFNRQPIDVVIAVGGGSAIDVAKSINYFHNKDSFTHPGKPLIAIPTTAGTGSEVTRYAVFYEGTDKSGFTDEAIRPDYALVYPSLTYSVPPAVTAATGMDALAQAIESHWAVDATTASHVFSREAIPLIFAHLKSAVLHGDPASREAMSRGALLSGQAIDITRTTACHAVSYPMTSYFGIPHGHAVGFTLAAMLEYNANVTADDCLHLRGADHVRATVHEIAALLGAATIHDAAQGLRDLMTAIGLATRFRDTSVSRDGLETILTHGFHPDRVHNNPRRLTPDALRAMLEALY